MRCVGDPVAISGVQCLWSGKPRVHLVDSDHQLLRAKPALREEATHDLTARSAKQEDLAVGDVDVIPLVQYVVPALQASACMRAGAAREHVPPSTFKWV
jgi:hypothetical protein